MGGAAALPKDHPALKGAGAQQKGYHRPAHRLPVGPPVHGGGIPQRTLVRGQAVPGGVGQALVQAFLAADGLIVQTAAGLPHQGQQLLKAHAQKVQRQPDALGVDPGGLPRAGAQRRQEHPGVPGGKDHRHAPVAPRLEQGLVVVEGGVQRADRAVLHPVEGCGLPCSGRGILQPAGRRGLQQPISGQGRVQMMGVQAQGAHPGLGQFHGGTPFGGRF